MGGGGGGRARDVGDKSGKISIWEIEERRKEGIKKEGVFFFKFYFILFYFLLFFLK